MTDKIILHNLDTTKHIHQVRQLLYKIILELDKRAREHDKSKFESPECEIFAEYHEEFSKVEYGCKEYNELKEKTKEATLHHYSKTRHHIESFQNGINGMNLVDLIEMLCDWKISSSRHGSGSIQKSIDYNWFKFGISAQLKNILENTVRDFDM